MNGFLLRGLLKLLWTAGHVGECLLVLFVVWSSGVSLSGVLLCDIGLQANVLLHVTSLFYQHAGDWDGGT